MMGLFSRTPQLAPDVAAANRWASKSKREQREFARLDPVLADCLDKMTYANPPKPLGPVSKRVDAWGASTGL